MCFAKYVRLVKSKSCPAFPLENSNSIAQSSINQFKTNFFKIELLKFNSNVIYLISFTSHKKSL